MNELEAQLQGKVWTKFEAISSSVREMYDLLLAVTLPGLKENLQKMPRAYELACEYWYNNLLDKTAEEMRDALVGSNS